MTFYQLQMACESADNTAMQIRFSISGSRQYEGFINHSGIGEGGQGGPTFWTCLHLGLK